VIGWFEMHDVRRRRLIGAVWLPLRAADYVQKERKYAEPGFVEEYLGAGPAAIPIDHAADATELGWHELGPRNSHGGVTASR
jgi:hypothetical protein